MSYISFTQQKRYSGGMKREEEERVWPRPPRVHYNLVQYNSGVSVRFPKSEFGEWKQEAELPTTGYSAENAGDAVRLFYRRSLFTLLSETEWKEKRGQSTLRAIDMYCVRRVIGVPKLGLSGEEIVVESHRSFENAYIISNLAVIKLLYNNDLVKEAMVEFQPLRRELANPALLQQRRIRYLVEEMSSDQFQRAVTEYAEREERH